MIRGILERILVPGILLLLIASCTLDLGEEAGKDLADSIPDTVIYNFSRTVYEKGMKRFEFSAQKGENFEKLQAIRLTAITFYEYESGTEKLIAKGSADFGIFYLNTESAELSGNVRYSNSKEDISVETGYLYWDGQERTLQSRLDILTTLRQKKSTLAGAGFHADAKTRSFWFDDYVSGSYTGDSTESTEPQGSPATTGATPDTAIIQPATGATPDTEVTENQP
ncbi:MAG TPA: LPS export ABC transporter periplasmic protein LptC [Spirochaetia bacterium]|nr:LPS export ABC transporter periplasmic protein LptC [Spirochaetales bacterium]HRS65657.1 LPS export ABC transporter periplasmic protein LptC [Spirochaetia bacterium]HOT58355.1 LPS export ABC transporter periplasmic protein LptC [Spirochaetales bacterium]HPD80056.1 LPS export ABC transporter periplasmic protein LptC [Spirochaetales bacterium]HQG39324.1 LPS export ABC transporter periplasmic protein LptC [Spirochaetales bacterium]